MRQEVKHIFDSSACLKRRQLKDYVNGVMSSEECHALEHHINSCFFCSEAIDGMMEHKDAMVAVDGLNTSFLKDHFSITHPHIHLNSMAPAAPVTPVARRHRSQNKVQPLLRPSGFAAFLLLALAIMWYLQSGKHAFTSTPVMESSVAASPVQPRQERQDQQTASEPKEGPITAASTVATTSVSETTPNNIEPQRPQSLIATDPKVANDKPKEKPEAASVTATTSTSAKKTPAIKAEKIEPIPTHQPVSTEASDKPSGITRFFKSIAAEGDETKSAKDETAKEDKADASKTSEKQLSSSETAQQEATLSAAKAELNAGDKDKAAKLLETVISEGSGSQRRQAKRLLRDLNKNTD